jgi:hypothetical protein
MVKNKSLAIIFLIFLIIGAIHGLISFSFYFFFSWILIGLWLLFTIKIFENIKRHREFNSPHNTAFFVILPLFIGFFYSMWGSFTGVFGGNLILNSSLYFSIWSLIFGFPYILYGSHSLYRCFKKYSVVYFGTKSVRAKTLGYFLAIIILICIISLWVISYNLIFVLDLNLLILFIATFFVLIIFGFAGTRSSIPPLTRDYITQRTRRINSLTTPTTQRQRSRTTRTSSPNPSTRTVTRTTRSSSNSTRSTPTSRSQTSRSRTSKTSQTRTVKPTQTRKARPSSKVRDLSKFKPKASYLSIEDFKCIFCFRLPKLPEDRGRGIIVCPNCRYPSHADEFKDWMRTSNLCSRCSAPIPSGFRRNPRIISVKNYLIIYKHFLKKH